MDWPKRVAGFLGRSVLDDEPGIEGSETALVSLTMMGKAHLSAFSSRFFFG